MGIFNKDEFKEGVNRRRYEKEGRTRKDNLKEARAYITQFEKEMRLSKIEKGDIYSKGMKGLMSLIDMGIEEQNPAIGIAATMAMEIYVCALGYEAIYNDSETGAGDAVTEMVSDILDLVRNKHLAGIRKIANERGIFGGLFGEQTD